MSNVEIDNAPFSVIMKENIKYSHEMYRNKEACELLRRILINFCDLAHERGQRPLLLVMPQLLDLKMINNSTPSPYGSFFSTIGRKVPVLDMTLHLNGENIEDLYTEDLYGGHFSDLGNKLVADKVCDFIKKPLI